jgi:hypothetical protein
MSWWFVDEAQKAMLRTMLRCLGLGRCGFGRPGKAGGIAFFLSGEELEQVMIGQGAEFLGVVAVVAQAVWGKDARSFSVSQARAPAAHDRPHKIK